jgi:fumarate reductase subunit D
MSNMNLNAKSMAGIAVLSVMIAVAAWVVMHRAHHDEQAHKVGVVVVEGL